MLLLCNLYVHGIIHSVGIAVFRTSSAKNSFVENLTTHDFPPVFPDTSLTVEEIEQNLRHATTAMVTFRKDIRIEKKKKKLKLELARNNTITPTA